LNRQEIEPPTKDTIQIPTARFDGTAVKVVRQATRPACQNTAFV
jgi:hypothetical protein